MSRRGENIYRRKDGRWEGRFINGRTPEGKAHYGYVYGKTYGEVKEKLKEASSKNALPSKDVQNSILYEGLLCRWLDMKANKVKKSTWSRYEYQINKYILPFLGNISVDGIEDQTIENFTAHLLSHGGRCGHGMASKSVNDILSMVKCSLEYANEIGYCTHCNLRKIRVQEHPKEMRVLSIQEQQRLQSFLMLSPNRSKLGVLLSLFTGIRIGELCALKWNHIQVEQGIIEIHETMQRIRVASNNKKTQIIISSPKSKCSFRTIPLPQFIIELIAPYKADPNSFFLTGKLDKYTEPRVLQNRFKKYMKECDLQNVNYHCLRHTFATRCVEIGFDIKTLSEILGHANVNITLNKYVHSSIALKKDNMNKLEQIAIAK